MCVRTDAVLFDFWGARVGEMKENYPELYHWHDLRLRPWGRAKKRRRSSRQVLSPETDHGASSGSLIKQKTHAAEMMSVARKHFTKRYRQYSCIENLVWMVFQNSLASCSWQRYLERMG